MAMVKFVYDGIEYEIQGFEDIDFEMLCKKQNINILQKNVIFSDSVDFTEYEVDGKWAYEIIITGLESFESDIIVMPEKQNPNLMYDVLMKNRQRAISEVLDDVQT
jgi:hypothetical protein